jgi:hypothetical protein
MAMLSWIKLNPTVKVINTKKKFFDSYLYKAVVYAPGCRIILNKKDSDARSMLEKRIQILTETKSYNYGGSWFRSTSAEKLQKEGKWDQLQFFIDNKEKFKDKIKIRVEEPHISLYSNDEQFLYDVCSSSYSTRLSEIHKPLNQTAEEVLNRGEIITSKKINYQYKILLKECVIHDSKLKLSLSNYLYNLGDSVKATKSLYKNLNSQFSYFNGGYFYAASEDIVTFVNLICPELVSRIYKLTVLEP